MLLLIHSMPWPFAMNTESKRLNWSSSSGTDEHWSLGISAGITLALDALVRVSNKVGMIFSSFFYVLSVKALITAVSNLLVTTMPP